MTWAGARCGEAGATALSLPEAALPAHVAIIPDGNRRFARSRGWTVERAYRAGANRMLDVVGWCIARGIRRLSGFALSQENVRTRPHDELVAVVHALERFADEMVRRYGTTPHFVGDLTELARHATIGSLRRLGEPPPGSATIAVHVVVNFSPETDLRVLGAALAGPRNASPALTAAIPPVDLLIRPGGHRRLSGFLPFHCAYAELWFCDTLWPAFTEVELDRALEWYAAQERTFGE